MHIYGKGLRSFTATHLFADDKGEPCCQPAVATPPSEGLKGGHAHSGQTSDSDRSFFVFVFLNKTACDDTECSDATLM